MGDAYFCSWWPKSAGSGHYCSPGRRAFGTHSTTQNTLLYLVIFRAIWQSVSLHCGSRWGAAAPGSFWVLERTPFWVYWTLLLSWTKTQLKKKSFLSNRINLFQSVYIYHRWADRSIPVLHLAGELLEDFGGAAVVFQLSLNQRCQLAHLLYLQHTNTHMFFFSTAQALSWTHAGHESGLAQLGMACDRCPLFFHCSFEHTEKQQKNHVNGNDKVNF